MNKSNDRVSSSNLIVTAASSRLRMLCALCALLAALALGSVAATPAFAGEPDAQYETLKARGAQALLEEADRRHNPFVDQTILVKMTLKGGANDGKTIKIETITKGENMRAFRFEEPADMKGMGVVIKGRDEIYVRLPGTEKVRRVGSHAKRQSFQGTDWNFDEMSMIRFSTDYEASIADETDTHLVLDLKRKSGSDLQYARLVLSVDKSILMIDQIEYYDDDGKAVKRQTRQKPKSFGGEHLVYSYVEMTDLAAGTTTVNEVLEEKIDSDVADDTFSRRWLVRGL